MTTPDTPATEAIIRTLWSDIARALRTEGVNEQRAYAHADAIAFPLRDRIEARSVPTRPDEPLTHSAQCIGIGGGPGHDVCVCFCHHTVAIDPAQFGYRWTDDEMVSDHHYQHTGCCGRLRSMHRSEMAGAHEAYLRSLDQPLTVARLAAALRANGVMWVAGEDAIDDLARGILAALGIGEASK